MTIASIPFASARSGMKARISSITEDNSDTRRLMEMGLTVGTEFEVVKVAPFGDPIEIEVRGYRLCLRKSETAGILIEPAVS